MELATVLGLIIGIGGILLGNFIEGGHTAGLIQGAAAIIVISGTIGAVLVSTKIQDVKNALQLAKRAFKKNVSTRPQLLLEIVDCSRLARKENILALEKKSSTLSDEFLKDVIRTVTDGVEPEILQSVFDTRIAHEEENLMAAAKVWTDAGGFSPTIGIIGAVLGLIHVMGNLSDTSKLGAGIAVAFVATIYGVGFANLVFLPLGNKIKRLIQDDMKTREMAVQGGLAIITGLSPAVTELKLKAYLESDKE